MHKQVRVRRGSPRLAELSRASALVASPLQAATPELESDDICAGPWTYDLFLALLREFETAWQTRAVAKPCAVALLKFAAALPTATLTRGQVVRLRQQLDTLAVHEVAGDDATLRSLCTELGTRLDVALEALHDDDAFAVAGRRMGTTAVRHPPHNMLGRAANRLMLDITIASDRCTKAVHLLPGRLRCFATLASQLLLTASRLLCKRRSKRSCKQTWSASSQWCEISGTEATSVARVAGPRRLRSEQPVRGQHQCERAPAPRRQRPARLTPVQRSGWPT